MTRPSRSTGPAVWTSSYNNLNSGPGRWAYDEVVHSRRTVPTSTESVSNYSIPKIGSYHERQRTEETYVSGHDTTRGEIIERISDEFRFLEERSNAPEKPRLRFGNRLGRLPDRYRVYVAVSIAVLQFVTTLALLVFAVIRYIRLFEGSPAGSDVLLDFVKAEDFAETNQAGAEIIAIKLGSALLAPSILQLISATVVFFLVKENFQLHLVLVHTLLSCVAIVLWFEPIYIAALELNLRYVQLAPLHDSATYRILIAVLCLATADVVVVGGFLTVFVFSSYSTSGKTTKSSLDLHVGTVTLVLSVVSCVLSAYATANSMTNVSVWENPLRNFTALYALGLKELIVTSFAMLTSIYSSASAVLRHRSLRLGAIALQSALFLALVVYAVNADRLTSVTHNAQRMLASRSTTPFSGEILILLYAFLVLLTISVLVQLVQTAIVSFDFRCSPKYRRTEFDEQRSAL